MATKRTNDTRWWWWWWFKTTVSTGKTFNGAQRIWITRAAILTKAIRTKLTWFRWWNWNNRWWSGTTFGAVEAETRQFTLGIWITGAAGGSNAERRSITRAAVVSIAERRSITSLRNLLPRTLSGTRIRTVPRTVVI